MPVPFLDARSRECRFPTAGEGVGLIVCGAAVPALGESYCRRCRSLAYRPVSNFDPHVRWCDPTVKYVPVPREGAFDLDEVFA